MSCGWAHNSTRSRIEFKLGAEKRRETLPKNTRHWVQCPGALAGSSSHHHGHVPMRSSEDGLAGVWGILMAGGRVGNSGDDDTLGAWHRRRRGNRHTGDRFRSSNRGNSRTGNHCNEKHTRGSVSSSWKTYTIMPFISIPELAGA